MVEWTSLWSDSNAQFPVGPCEYGGPFGALIAGDTKAVFLLEEPEKIPREGVWEKMMKSSNMENLISFFSFV